MAEAASVSLARKTGSSDRRLDKRRSVLESSLVSVELEPAGTGLLLDVSSTGVGVQINQQLQPGTELLLGFQIPEIPVKVEGIGVVSWCDAEGRVGIRFQELNHECTHELSRWIESLPPVNAIPDPSGQPIRNVEDDLAAIRSEIGKKDEKDEQLQTLIEQITGQTKATGGAIAVGDPELMICRASTGIAPEIGVQISSGSALTQECLRTKKSIHCNDTETDPRVDPEVCRQMNLRSLLIVPILADSRLKGVLEVFSSEAGTFRAADIALVEGACRLASEVLGGKVATKAKSVAPPVVERSAPQVSSKILSPSVKEILPEPGTLGEEIESELDLLVAAAKDPNAKDSAASMSLSPSMEAELEGLLEDVKRPTKEERPRASRVVAALPIPRRLEHGTDATSAVKPKHIAAVAVIFLAILIAAGAGWYRSRTRTSTVPAQAPASANPQTASLPAVSTPSTTGKPTEPAAETKRSGPKPSRKTPTEEESLVDDSVRTASATAIQPAARSIAPKNEPLVDAPAITVVDSNMGKVPMPAIDATPALKVASTVTGGQLLQRVEPAYPAFARQQRYQGNVVLAIRISKTGAVDSVRRVSGNPMLSSAAVEAVKRWKYEPYKLNGQPQETETTVTIKFKLPD
jgi:TonB family protein